MNRCQWSLWLTICIASLSIETYAQKVTVGYEKGVDFKRFKTYMWAEQSAPVTRPLLYMTVTGAVDDELKSKGLARVDSNADLVVVPEGGTDLGLNQAAGTPISPTFSGPPPTLNATMWTGSTSGANLMAPFVQEGTLGLTFVDRNANQVVWTGSVREKLDIDNKQKSLERVDKAIVKLLRQFPPNRK